MALTCDGNDLTNHFYKIKITTFFKAKIKEIGKRID